VKRREQEESGSCACIVRAAQHCPLLFPLVALWQPLVCEPSANEVSLWPLFVSNSQAHMLLLYTLLCKQVLAHATGWLVLLQPAASSCNAQPATDSSEPGAASWGQPALWFDEGAELTTLQPVASTAAGRLSSAGTACPTTRGSQLTLCWLVVAWLEPESCL